MFCVCDTVEMEGEIGQTFPAIIDGSWNQISITVETKCGIITKVIPGPRPGTECSYMIKFMCFQFPIEVDEDYIVHMKQCC